MFGLFKKPTPKVTRITAPSGAVQRSTATLLQQRGWKSTWSGWAGPYATRYGTWPGRLENAGGGKMRVFIRNPPAELQRHQKWHCFHNHSNDGWYSIHLATDPIDGDPGSIVRYVEQLITESFKL